MKRSSATFVVSVATMLMAAAACTNFENPTAPGPPQLVVHSILDTRFDKIVVLVARARTGVPRAVRGIGEDDPISDATVTVRAPNGTVMVVRNDIAPGATYGPGIYALNPSDSGVRLSDGGTYALHILTKTGEEVSGTTTIPEPPALQQLAQRLFLRARDTLRLSWPQIAGARSYEFVIGYQDDVYYRVFTDTNLSLPGTAVTILGDPVFPGGPSQFFVEAVDVNYYDYYRMESDPFAGAAPSHLTGAVGVFGSITPILFGELNVR
ncbi:MAG TPA: DUF4249 family protein [Gemmatimonadaceae bacterium]|nr:DUF4249 family protein [Gemmatimonadaceae bacterium]